MMASSDHRILVSDVNDHILCRLCRGYLIDATTLTQCLHSFCRSCIRRHLATTGQCPQCELSGDFVSTVKPRMRRDRTLQRLVYKLVPGLLQSELSRRQVHDKSMQSSALNDTSLKSVDGNELAAYQLHTNEETFNVCLQLFKRIDDSSDGKLQQEVESLTPRYLLCPALFTVNLLKKFIRLKLDLSSATHIDIVMCEELLVDSYTLTDLAYIFKLTNDEPMKMLYTVHKGSPASVPTVEVAAAADTGCRTDAVSNSDVGNRTASVVAMETTVISTATTQNGIGLVPGTPTALDTSKPMEVTSNDDPQPVVTVIRKKRGRKPKHRRLGRLLNIQHVQRAPLPDQSTNSSNTLSADPPPPGVVVKKKRGRKPKNRCVEPIPASAPPAAESHPEPSPSGEAPGLSTVNNGYSEVNASDTNDSVSKSSGCEVAQAVKQKRGRKRKTAVVTDSNEEAMKQAQNDDSQTVWKVTSEQVNHDDVIPRIKMTSVRVSRDNSAAAKWLVRPARDSRQLRKRKPDETTDGIRDESRTNAEQGQIPGSAAFRTHQNEAPVLQHANLFQPSLCSAMASWNAAALASVQLLRPNESIGLDHVVPVTSQHQVALTRLQDFQPMFGFGQMPSSAVTINDVGSEVMFVVGSDRRLGTMPIKLSDVIQLDSSGGGVGIESCETGILQQSKVVDAGITGPGRIATVRPLDHGKIASQLLSQRVHGDGSIILDRNGESVVLVSTIPPDCVLAETLTKGQQNSLTGIQTSTMSSTDGKLLTMTVPAAGPVESPDHRSDDCFEITSTVADDACVISNSPQPSAVQEQHQADVAIATATHCEERSSRTDETASSQEVIDTVVGLQRQEQEHINPMKTTAASTTTTTTSSSANQVVQTNSTPTALSRPKPKKSLETVISLLKRPVSTDSSSLSQSVVDRMLSSLSSSIGRSELRADANSSCVLITGNRDVAASSTSSPTVMMSDHCQRRASVQPSMTSSSSLTQNDLRLSSIISTSCATSNGDFSPSIKRLTNMCNNMSPQSLAPWQPEMGSIAQRPQWVSFCQPPIRPLSGSWMTPVERFRQDTAPLELTTRDRRQHPVRQQSPSLGRTVVESHVRPAAAAECHLSVPSQPQFSNRGWRF